MLLSAGTLYSIASDPHGHPPEPVQEDVSLNPSVTTQLPHIQKGPRFNPWNFLVVRLGKTFSLHEILEHFCQHTVISDGLDGSMHRRFTSQVHTTAVEAAMRTNHPENSQWAECKPEGLKTVSAAVTHLGWRTTAEKTTSLDPGAVNNSDPTILGVGVGIQALGCSPFLGFHLNSEGC